MKRMVAVLLVSLFFGALSYIVLSDLLCALAVFLLFALILFMAEWGYLSNRRKIDKREHACFSFTRSFLLSLIASNSYEQALDAALTCGDSDLVVLNDALKGKDVKEKLLAFADYFEDDHYCLFLSILDLFEKEGGDIALLSDPFLSETTEKEKDLIRREGAKKKSLSEFMSLLFMGAFVIGFLRYGLSGFYSELSINLAYKLCALLYFVFTALSLLVFAKTRSACPFALNIKKGVFHGKKKKDTAKAE